jgi:hypothetical protein
MHPKANETAKPKAKSVNSDTVDKEIITVVDSSKSYYEAAPKSINWEMSATEALQVNYLTRTNRSAIH